MKQLLIVDDDVNTLCGLGELLRQEGYLVREVTRGQAAFEAAATEPIDIVLCDYRLPDLGGLEVCRELKRRHPHLVLFLVTAYRNTEVMNALQPCGIEKIIDKPIVLDELFATLAAGAATTRNQKAHVAAPPQKTRLAPPLAVSL